jgi:hypothetical protein
MEHLSIQDFRAPLLHHRFIQWKAEFINPKASGYYFRKAEETRITRRLLNRVTNDTELSNN